LKGARATFLDLSAQKESNADSWDQLSNLSVNSGPDRQSGSPFSQMYAIGNPHDREETMHLSIRPISVPPDWKLSVVNAGSGQAAKPGDAPPKFPVVEREPGKHYAVTLPPKTEITVASVVVPMSEQGAWTTARWAVEGKIGDELVGGIVHELNVPYVVADLKLPDVGSKEEEDFELPPARRLPSKAIVAVSGGAVVLIVLTLVILKRRRRREIAP